MDDIVFARTLIGSHTHTHRQTYRGLNGMMPNRMDHNRMIEWANRMIYT